MDSMIWLFHMPSKPRIKSSVKSTSTHTVSRLSSLFLRGSIRSTTDKKPPRSVRWNPCVEVRRLPRSVTWSTHAEIFTIPARGIQRCNARAYVVEQFVPDWALRGEFVTEAWC